MEESSQPSATPAKSGGMGCGTVIAIIIVILILGSLGFNEGFGYYLEHCAEKDIIECLLEGVEEPEPEGAVTATGTYTYEDYSVNVTANIPLEGGNVTGTVSEACEGKVKATFSGQNNGVISGKLIGGCSPFFVNVPASADFSGIVNKDSKTVPFDFTGQGAGITHKGSMSLSY